MVLPRQQPQLDSKHWAAALDLSRRCVERDPQFARHGRGSAGATARGEFGRQGGNRREPGQRRASPEARARINPDLSLVHNCMRSSRSSRARGEAMVELLDRVERRRRSPSSLRDSYTPGLLWALDAFEAADERARRPILRRYEHRDTFGEARLGEAIAPTRAVPPSRKSSRWSTVEPRQAAAVLRGTDRARTFVVAAPLLEGLLDFAKATAAGCSQRFIAWSTPGRGDPEALYHRSGSLCESGDHDGALGLLERALDARLLSGVDPGQRSALLFGARGPTL